MKYHLIVEFSKVSDIPPISAGPVSLEEARKIWEKIDNKGYVVKAVIIDKTGNVVETL